MASVKKGDYVKIDMGAMIGTATIPTDAIRESLVKENVFRKIIRDAIIDYMKEQEEDKIDVNDENDKKDVEETTTTGNVEKIKLKDLINKN